MDKIYTKEQLDQFEKAIDFLVDQVQNFCRNEKPVILHSIRVGVRLIEQHEDETTIQYTEPYDILKPSSIPSVCTTFCTRSSYDLSYDLLGLVISIGGIYLVKTTLKNNYVKQGLRTSLC